MNRKKIPTIIGLILTLVLVVGVAATTSVVQRVTSLFSQASSSIVPNSVSIANLTDKGFTVYWTSQSPTLGTVSYGKTATLADGIAVDDRNLTSPNEKYVSHFARVSGLSPGTKYFYNVSGREEAPLEVTTLSQVPGKPAVDPAFGKITDASGSPLAGVVVVLTVGADKSATLSKNDGSYVLPASATTANGQAETISFLYGADIATVTCKVGQDRPLPTIKMGDNVDCTKTITTSAAGSFKSSATGTASGSGTLTINISDRETVSTPLPTISGKAGANQMVTIVVNSNTPLTASVKAGADGNWSWTPPSSLNPGQHTVAATVTNTDGSTQTINRTFFVPGTSILPVTSGTPSAEIFHLACISEACTKISGAGSDTCTTNKDCVPAVTVTIPATPAATTTPVVTTTPPATGALEDTVLLLGIGMMLIFLGLIPKLKVEI